MRPLVIFLGLLSVGLCHAESRKWTNSGGRVIEAEYIGTRDKNVVLKLKDGREVSVELSTLSPEDQEFVGSNAREAPAAAATSSGKKAVGFGQVTIDKAAWVMRPRTETFGVTGVELTHQLETPHFLITAVPKVKPAMMETHAEVAERLYAQMSRDFPALETKFKDRRMAVWLTTEKPEHLKLGESLNAIGGSSTPWTNSISSMSFSNTFAEANKLTRWSRGFNTGEFSGMQKNLLWPERIHFMAASMIGSMGHAYRTDGRSLDMFNLCYSYFEESDITGKVETKVSFSNGQNPVEGFKNSRGWPEAVKRLLNNTPLKPGIKRFLSLDPTEAEPIDLGTGFGLVQWILQDPPKLAAMNRILEKAAESQTAPTPEEFAGTLGFTTPEAFDQAWFDYLKSDRFK